MLSCLSKFQSIYGTLDKTEIYLNSGLYWGGWWIDAYWCQTTNWTNVDLFHQWGHLVFTLSRIRCKIYQNICKTQMHRQGISTALVCNFSVITCIWTSLYKYLDGLLRECGISSASAMEMLHAAVLHWVINAGSVRCRYNVIQCNVLFHTTLQWLSWSMCLNSRNDTQYLARKGELWGVCCEDLGWNSSRFNGTILYAIEI